MDVIFDTYGLFKRFKQPKGNISDVRKAGFSGALLDFRNACPPGIFKHMTRSRNDAKAEGEVFLPDEPERIGETVKPFLDACNSNGIQVKGAMAPVIPLDRSNPLMNDYQRVLSASSVRCAMESGCKWCIVPPLFVGIPLEKEKDVNIEFYRSFIPILKEYSEKHPDKEFKILLQNQCRDHSGHLVRGILSDADEAVEWLNELNEDSRNIIGRDAFGFCLNIGHVNICGQDLDEITPVLGDYIETVVLTDNDGNEDCEMLPFSCASRGIGGDLANADTDWRSVIRGLRKIKYDGPVIFSMSDTLAAFPVFIWPQLIAFAKTVSDFFVWQLTMEQTISKYSHVVLFGAGNMCRNYMMDYGEKYHPLFTCDNNSNRWGEEFCGLEIKSPESLKDLPEDTGIFICNEYYTEIRSQLESMGIKSKIEYYSDRYPNTEARTRLKGLWKNA
ncbi:MAG: sugar phosphate isomerase/epimerase [Lachnospiraceae bacterium]|nr:MAG: sugar phosphate isomerase/epimerase [Lachnospiraceae bacterium]